MNNVFFNALRRLRWPLAAMIIIFALSTAGVALIPGVDANGQEWRPSIFQALYFVAYTATTIGYGELPQGFSDIQRLWVTIVIFMSVFGWAYLLASVLALFQDKGFQSALIHTRFRNRVQKLQGPFYILCGLGETGRLVAQALDQIGHQFSALDIDEQSVLEFDLQNLRSDHPALAANATLADNLLIAGLNHPRCKGVLALTAKDEVNLAIGVAVRLLKPQLRLVSRASNGAAAASMRMIGVDEVINPFYEFASSMDIAMRAPDTHRLLSWLTEARGAFLPPRIPAPPGRWVVCGHGRFGAEMVQRIEQGGYDVTIIDPAVYESSSSQARDLQSGMADGDNLVSRVRHIAGAGTDEAVLLRAGLAAAHGLVAGTDDDTANLAIAMTSRRINPNLFVIARQNLVASGPLFEAFKADMTMVPSAIIANQCLAVLRTAHLSSFLREVRRRENEWARELIGDLTGKFGARSPEVWSCALIPSEAPGLLDAIKYSVRAAQISDLVGTSQNGREPEPCVALALVREDAIVLRPEAATPLKGGDQLLLAGVKAARHRISAMMLNANAAKRALGSQRV